MGRQLTATAAQMLAATRLLHAPKLLPVHDEHKPFGPLLKIASSIRDLDTVEHSDVEIIDPLTHKARVVQAYVPMVVSLSGTETQP